MIPSEDAQGNDNSHNTSLISGDDRNLQIKPHRSCCQGRYYLAKQPALNYNTDE